MNQHIDPSQRHDFVLFFECIDGNPNGDPDAGNLPRVDPETMQGLVTDVCIKRKIRDYVAMRHPQHDDNTRFNIYISQGAVLNEQHELAYKAKEIKPTNKPKGKEKQIVRSWMCDHFYDVRMFGAVMSTGVNCGQVRGPAQLTFSRSVDPVTPMDITITRIAVTKAGEDKETEMGRKSIIPYGLYRAHGFFSPHFAKDTGVDSEDLALFWNALINMWDLDHSASRGMMSCRGLYVFSHENGLGNAPAHALFDRIQVSRKDGVDAPRSFHDYTVGINDKSLPQGISLTSLI